MIYAMFSVSMLTILVGVVSYFGLPQLGATLEATRQVAESIKDKGDFSRFVRALFTYVNRYNLWLHHTFPWKLGTLFPKATGYEASTIVNLLAQARYQGHH